MSRFLLALKCFFLVLFRRSLPSEALALLPPPEPALLAPHVEAPEPAPEEAPAAVERPAEPPAKTDDALARGAILLLGALQREGRLVDFLEENIDSYSDDQIGAAVRDIHRGCRKALAEHLRIAPVLSEPESATVRVEHGFDPSRIRLVGNVVGQPPFTGTLRHPGWCGEWVTATALPDGHDPSVIAPAEVEL